MSESMNPTEYSINCAQNLPYEPHNYSDTLMNLPGIVEDSFHVILCDS